MRISIITPSFRNSQWLRLCVASVADQKDVDVEHIVQDSCSDDGTQDWLPKDSRVKPFIEKDQGMYDAVNRGFSRATGDVVAYLNCDEQFLPGALKVVHDYFASHPQTDVLLSDTVVTDSDGNYICHRLSVRPNQNQMWVRFPAVSCSLFVRGRVVRERGIVFDTQWRDLGDWFWVMEMVKQGLQIDVLPKFTSVFADTGENMNLKPNALRERRIKWEMAPAWVRLFKHLFWLQYRFQITARAPLHIGPFDYSLYTLSSPTQRVMRHAPKPTSFWRGRMKETL